MKLKRSFFGIIVATVCALYGFFLVACVETDSDKDNTVYYTVTFHCNSGIEEDTVRKQVEKGKTAADKVPDVMIKTGYTFDGWYIDEAFTQEFDIADTPITSDLSLYARWKKDCDRAWFLSKLGECAANAEKDGIAYKQVSYKAKIDGKTAENFTSEIVNDCIFVGEYSFCIRIDAEKFEKEVLTANTVSSERYAQNGEGFSATIHYANS
ncbi:MAG: InlB B-repeat-containing protein, partial [Christensenellales bacterium]